MNTNQRRELFESAPIPRALTSMAVPTIISQLINLVYNIVDTFFIGRTGNSYMVAAVTVAFTVYMMTVAISNLFGIGGGSLIARLIGRGRAEDAKKICSFSFFGALVSALLYSLLVALFCDPILRLLGASDATIGFARQYVLLVVICGNLPVILSMTLAHLLRNAGYSKQASIGLSSGGILNILLDPLFMFVLLPDGQEVFGAALATLIANIVSCIYLLIVLCRAPKDAPLSIRMKNLSGIRHEDLRELFAVGVPSAILTGLFDIANIFLNALTSDHGDLELAAMGIVMKAERLPNAINIGICQGMLPIVAYNYASGNHDRMREVIRTARKTGLLIAACSLILFEIFATPIIHVFLSTSAEHVEDAVKTIGFAVVFLRLRCIASPMQFLNYHTSYCMQAMGDGRDTLLHAVARELVFYIPLMYLLDALFNMNGLAFALVVGEGLGAAFAILLLQRWLHRLDHGKNVTEVGH